MCQRSSNHKLKAIHNSVPINLCPATGVSKIVKSQIESNSQPAKHFPLSDCRCVKDRQITNWKQFTTMSGSVWIHLWVCQRSSNHKLKAIHNLQCVFLCGAVGVSKIVKSQIESNSQQIVTSLHQAFRCVKDRQITNWKQFTTSCSLCRCPPSVCQRSSNHKLKAIHNWQQTKPTMMNGVSKIVKSQIESNSQPHRS